MPILRTANVRMCDGSSSGTLCLNAVFRYVNASVRVPVSPFVNPLAVSDFCRDDSCKKPLPTANGLTVFWMVLGQV